MMPDAGSERSMSKLATERHADRDNTYIQILHNREKMCILGRYRVLDISVAEVHNFLSSLDRFSPSGRVLVTSNILGTEVVLSEEAESLGY